MELTDAHKIPAKITSAMLEKHRGPAFFSCFFGFIFVVVYLFGFLV
jgi:hypothetical protein